MVKVTVDRFKSVMSDLFLHKTLTRLLPFSVPQNFFGRTLPLPFSTTNTDVQQRPFLLDSMFPSLFDGIRYGRYLRSPPHMEWGDVKGSSKSSSDVRIIPARVSSGQSQRTPKPLNEVNPIILDDDVAELDDCTIEDSSTSSKGIHKNLNGVTFNLIKSADSTIILDDEDVQEVVHLDDLSPKDSKCSLNKSSTEIHSELNTVNIQPVPVLHLELILKPHADKNANNCAEEKNLQLANSIIIKDDGVDEEDIDFSDTVSSRDVSSRSIEGLKTRDCHFEELKDSPPPIDPGYDILVKKLAIEGRKIYYITGDGNCFFRALSTIIYGCEKYHKEVRSFVIDIIATNKAKFAQFIDGEDVQKHIEKMSEDRCWATTCEIYAAATVLQTDIFMFTPNHLSTAYSWLLFKPLFKVHQSHFTKYQCCITLCNTNGIHYDVIVADHGKCNCFLPHPTLGGISASIDLS